MKFVLTVAVAVALNAACAQHSYSDGVKTTDWEGCRATNSCKISYDHLATQDTDPFHFNGKEMNDRHPRWRQFYEALELYPDVRECLVPIEKTKDNPNLLLMDWHAVGTGRSAEVCMYRIMRSLDDVELIKAWLKFHDFKFGEKRWRVDENYIPRLKTRPVSKITAWWSLEQYREVNPSLLAQLTGVDLLLSYQVVVGFSREDKVTSFSVVSPSK